MSRRTALLAGLSILAVAAALVTVWAQPAWADNCGSPADCFGTAGSFGTATTGLLALVGLSLLLDFVPVVGTGKGIVEAVTGRDLVTGQELSWWERALGIVPVVGGLTAVAGVTRAADAISDVGRGADRLGDIVDGGRAAGRVDDAVDAGRGVDRAGEGADAAHDVNRGFDTADHPDLRDLPRKPTPQRTSADRYEIRQTGPDNFRFRDGGEQVWADGYRGSERAILDAKHVGSPRSSPFVDDSAIPPKIRDKILTKVHDEFRRYAEVINDPGTTPRMLEVITNSEAARPFFERLLTQYGIPGRVIVVP